MRLPEKFVRHIWRNFYLRRDGLCTVDNQPLEIFSTGTLNLNEGADFSNATLSINGITQTGSVEIHTRTSDWTRHNHNANPRYQAPTNNGGGNGSGGVILHAVFEHDEPAPNAIPVLELRRFLNDDLHRVMTQCVRDESALNTRHILHCHAQVGDVPDRDKALWLDALALTRFERKAQQFSSTMNATVTDATLTEESLEEKLDEVIYHGAARALGYSENTAGMETLASLVRFGDLRRFASLAFAARRETLESIFFFHSGLMPASDTVAEIQTGDSADVETPEYLDALRRRFNESGWEAGETMDKTAWLFFRLRPANFPTARIAGLCELLSKNLERGFLKQSIDILSMPVPERRRLKVLESLFTADASGYWQTHYRFGITGSAAKPSGSAALETPEKGRQLIGKNRAAEIVINVALPALGVYAELKESKALSSLVQALYQAYPKSLTSEVSKQVMAELFGEGYTARSAAVEQALLELKKTYCDEWRCLDCRIGRHIFGLPSK